MSKHAKAQRIIEIASAVLAEHNPMTLRQVYYQLVSRQVIENNRSEYQAVSNALVYARQESIIPWDWIEDRTRKPRHVNMWDGLEDFGETILDSYRRNVWATQPRRVECWLEKDALSGIFQDVLEPYGVTLNVGRGYDGWDSIHNAAERWGDGSGVTVLYFGDFDGSGVDMTRSLIERWGQLECIPEVVRCALNQDDVQLYHLPPNRTKQTDTRSKEFVKRFGDACVELDALPIEVLQERITSEVESRLDLKALAAVKRQESTERRKLAELLGVAS